VTLDREDKRPYGAYLAYESLKYFFPGTTIEPVTKGFRFTDLGSKMPDSGRALMIFTGLDFYLSDKEWTELKDFVAEGNDAIIFCSNLDRKIEDELNCHKRGSGEDEPLLLGQNRHVNRNALSLVTQPWITYGYEGRTLQGYFFQEPDDEPITPRIEDDTTGGASPKKVRPNMLVLGNVKDNPNFVRFISHGDGTLTLHAAPLAMSNYFLLQPGNENYLTGIWQSLPDNITHIYWNDYFKRTSEVSSLGVLMRYPATRLAIQLALLVLLLYVLFEGKRKQRLIPIKEQLKNESVSFVETVGRLYYNKGNHANLAAKISQQFLEYVRNNYLINTNLLNESFIHMLTIKSGQPEATVRGLTDMIHEIRLGTTNIDEAYLYQLYHTTQQFYKTRNN
jgi:hypothetical protein